MDNIEISQLLKAVAAVLQVENAEKNKFRTVAYERAADAAEHASSELKDLWDEGELEKVSGIGKSIAEHLGEIFHTGKSEHFENILKNTPPAVFEFLRIPGVGPKSAMKFSDALEIRNAKNAVKMLENAAKGGKIASLEGFGVDSEKVVLQGIKEMKGRKASRMLLTRAEEVSEPLLDYLKTSKAVVRADVLGSQRRRASTVGDIDLAVASNEPKAVIKHFTNYPKKSRILEEGRRTASIILPGNIQVDLLVESPSGYGATLQHFTGSKHHNIKLREVALKKGWSLSDYGLKIGDKLFKFKTEEELYSKLGMDWIPPELREDTGEIEAAIRHVSGESTTLPKLIETRDIKGDLHMHSSFEIETSHDLGASSMREMVEKANELRYQYIAFTEHNPAQRGHSASQIVDLLKRKKGEVEHLNYSFRSVKKGVKKVFNGLEIDILPDGSLPVPEEGLAALDFALVSLHSSFRLSKKLMTKRVMRALEHPKVKIFAHPTARRLTVREGVELDWDSIFDYCARYNKWVEINASPERLDLPDFLVREAVKQGVTLTVDTDAHHAYRMDNMKYAVYVARRGWAEKRNIANTLPLSKFEEILYN